MRVLVTGAAGFIGHAVSKELSIRGETVLGVDKYTQYYSTDLKRQRVAELKNIYNVEVKDHDLNNFFLTSAIISKFQPECIIHLAGQPGVRLPLARSIEYVSENSGAFTVCLSSAIQNEIPRFLYASSSSVYGNSIEKNLSETLTGLRPISAYGASKLSTEFLAPTLLHNSNTKARGLRFFSVYGPWGRPDMAYFRIICSALTKSKFGILGDGHSSRDFTYIDDVTESLILLDQDLAKREASFHDVVNVGGGKPHSVLDMIKFVEELSDKKINLELKPRDQNDVNSTRADFSYLKSLINMVPSIDLKSGLASCIEWASRPGIREKIEEWTMSV
jgi:UDP-glucuronate 4-epimerase